MFGLFGKSGFESEMDVLDKKYKSMGAEMMIAMNSFQIQKQMALLLSMADICEQKSKCCKKYGKFEEMAKWQEAKEKALKLHG